MRSKGLFDLVEGRWTPAIQAFTKIKTHKTNLPYAICNDEKLKLEMQQGGLMYRGPIRYKIVPNGQLQYSNTFILNKKKK